MRVLVSGATGLVGRALVRRLVERGTGVVAWVRSPGRARAQLGAAVELLPTDEDEPGLRAALARCEAVVNLAGENLFDGRWTDKRRAVLVRSRVDVTRRLVDALAATSPRPAVLVSASAIGYYAGGGGDLLDEAAPAGEGFLAELTRRWEQEATRAAGLGLRVVLPRMGIVLAREGGALARMLPLFRRGLGGRLGSGRQYVSWIHAHDLCELLLRALDDERVQGPLNATAPGAVTNAELTRALARVVGRAAWLPAPAPLLRLALGDAAGVLLASQRVVPRALEALGFVFRFPDLEQALADLVGPAEPAAV